MGALAAILLLLLSVPSAHADDFAVSALWADMEHFAALTPRREGSAQEREALAYARARLVSMGADPRSVPYAGGADMHSYSSGLEVALGPGSGPALLVIAPVDQPAGGIGARGGDAGLALALHLCERLIRTPPPVPVRVVFLGAEWGEGEVYPLGSRSYLERMEGAAVTAVLYLDLAGLATRISLVAASEGRVAPHWLVRDTAGALAAAGVGYRMRGNLIQLNRLGLDTSTHPVSAYLAAGYPAVALVGGPAYGSPEPEAERWVSALDTAVDRLLYDLRSGVPPGWDRHYVAFQAGGRLITVPEGLYIGLLGLVVAACLLYGAFSGSRGARYAVALARGSWSIPLHLAMLFVFALVPTLILLALLELVGFPTLWTRAPVEAGLLKVLLSGSLFALLTPLVTRTFLPRSDSFYASAALTIQGLLLVAVSLYEVSLGFYFAWGLVFLLLSTLARERVTKIVLFLLAPLWTVRAVIEMFWLGEIGFIRWVLLDRFTGSAVAAAVAAPYYFMALRLRLLLRTRRHRLRRRLIALAGAVLLMAATVTAAWIAYERPYRGGASRPLTARAVFDYTTGEATLFLECPIAIGEAVVQGRGGTSHVVTRSREARLDLEPRAPPLRIETAGAPFLSRRNLRITLSTGDPEDPWPYRLALRLRSDREFVIFEASLPFQRVSGGLEYRISVGAGPPRPLEIDVTLPQGLGLELVAEARYLELPAGLAVSSAGAVIQPEMEVRVALGFST